MVLQAEKERRIKEQELYRNYLQSQMKQMEDREVLLDREMREYLDYQKREQNAGTKEIKRRVGRLDVHTSNITF